MKGQFVKSNVSDLPKWAKGIIAVAIVGGVGFIAYKIYKKIQQSNEEKGSKQENSQAQSELDKLIKKGIKPTYQQSQYSSYANTLWEAMDGYGTNEDLIMRVFANLKNDADFLSLSKAYGIRTVSSGVGNPEPNYRGTLSGALASELENSKIRDINASMSKKGITYKF